MSDWVQELKLLALKSVLLEDDDYLVRKVCREYSEIFHTPLHEVYELSWEFILTNYYEHAFDKMDFVLLKNEAKYLTESEEDKKIRIEREAKKKAEDDAYERKLQQELELLKKQTKELTDNVDKLADLNKKIAKTGIKPPKQMTQPFSKNQKEIEIPKSDPNSIPEVKIEFVEEDLEDWDLV